MTGSFSTLQAKRSVGSADSVAGPSILVLNRQRRFPVDVPALQAFAERALILVARLPHASPLPAEITAVLVNDRKMRQIHRAFMGLASSTDVITFQHGDIVLSVETARRQAGEHRTSVAHEARLYLVHGLLHVCGYDDLTRAGYEEMSCLQEGLLKPLI